MKKYPYNYSFDVPENLKIRLIINTDCKNEADDQFALVQALMTPKFKIAGVIAAHFGTRKFHDSMSRSYDEIVKILDLMDLTGTVGVFRGAETAIPDESTPVLSEGSQLIIKEALKDDPSPLYAIFWGPLTDMASALISRPEIASRVNVIWIGGAAWPVGGNEFNLSNDIHAANVIMKSQLPVQIITSPGFNHIFVSFAEIEYRVARRGKIGAYLFEQLVQFTADNADSLSKRRHTDGETWCLGDSPSLGLLMNQHGYAYIEVPAPLYSPDMYYIHTNENRPVKLYDNMDSRFLLEDFYSKLALNYPD